MESSAGVAERVERPGGRAGRPAPRAPLPAAARDRLDFAEAIAHVHDYVALTKPRIISLLLWTTVATMFVARPERPGALDGALDLPRRLSGRRRRRCDQPLHRPRHRRPHGPDRAAARSSPAGSALPRARLRDLPRRRRHGAALDHRQRPGGRPGAARPARLRAPLHGLAEAADAAEHRHRRRRRRDAAAGRLGGGDRLRSASRRSSRSWSSSSGRHPTSGRWRC